MNTVYLQATSSELGEMTATAHLYVSIAKLHTTEITNKDCLQLIGEIHTNHAGIEQKQNDVLRSITKLPSKLKRNYPEIRKDIKYAACIHVCRNTIYQVLLKELKTLIFRYLQKRNMIAHGKLELNEDLHYQYYKHKGGIISLVDTTDLQKIQQQQLIIIKKINQIINLFTHLKE